MMILYGDRVDSEKLGSNITMIHVDMPVLFGCHHSKIMILQYKDDGIRVVVSTTNLYSDDWENRTLWISPHLPKESANSIDGESPTDFKKDLVQYLSKYRHLALTQYMGCTEGRFFCCECISCGFCSWKPQKCRGRFLGT